MNTLMLRISQYILGIRSYGLSMSNIFKQLGWLSYPQMIIVDSIKMIYRIDIIGKPRAMSKYFTFTNAQCDNVRLVRTPSIKFKPNLVRTTKLQLYRGIQYYSSLPLEIRISDNKTLKNKLKQYIVCNTSVYISQRP